MTTKKARKAWGTIALTILTLLVLNQVVSIARAAMEPTILTLENVPLNWDDRAHPSEVPSSDPLPEVAREKEYDIPATVEEKIAEAFGEKAHEALAIAHCESRLVPDRVGDSHLAFEKDGQTYGESYGLFQIRSGGKGWVRTNNVEQFKQDMFNPEKNIETAKKLHEAHGDWSPWYNCAVKNNLI